MRHSNPHGLPQHEHLEADDFAARLVSADLRLTSIGAENAYAVDAQGREFYANDVLAAALNAALDAAIALGADAADLERA